MKTTTILILLVAACLASCKSHKSAEDSIATSVTTPTTTITTPKKQTPQDDPSAVTNFTSKIHATVNLDGKEITCPGNLRLRRGDVIQLSLADPIIGISEILRLEFSPNDILLIDRYNKQYVQMTREEIKTLVESYSPNMGFIVDAMSYGIIEDRIWSEIVDGDRTELDFDLPIGKPIKLHLRLSKKQPGNANWEAHTSVSSDRLRKVSPTDLIKSYSSALQ